MNLKQIRDRIEEDIYPLQIAPDEILRRVNQEMEYVSRELRIPRASWDNVVPDADVNFEPPLRVRDTSIHGFYEASGGAFHPVYTVGQADGLFPGWRDSTYDQKLIVHDAGQDDMSFVFRGFDSTELLTFVAVMVPNDMETDSDTPFDGEFEEFHELIPIKTVAEILRTEGRRRTVMGKTEEGAALIDWAREERADFDREMKKAFARVWDYDTYNLGGYS